MKYRWMQTKHILFSFNKDSLVLTGPGEYSLVSIYGSSYNQWIMNYPSLLEQIEID